MPKEKILVVDDEEDILELVKYNLEREGFQIRCAESGEKALNRTQRERPDLIVLDLMLPGIDGLEVARQLKQDKKTAGIPIVMLTAKGEEADIVTGLERRRLWRPPGPPSPRAASGRALRDQYRPG